MAYKVRAVPLEIMIREKALFVGVRKTCVVFAASVKSLLTMHIQVVGALLIELQRPRALGRNQLCVRL